MKKIHIKARMAVNSLLYPLPESYLYSKKTENVEIFHTRVSQRGNRTWVRRCQLGPLRQDSSGPSSQSRNTPATSARQGLGFGSGFAAVPSQAPRDSLTTLSLFPLLSATLIHPLPLPGV